MLAATMHHRALALALALLLLLTQQLGALHRATHGRVPATLSAAASPSGVAAMAAATKVAAGRPAGALAGAAAGEPGLPDSNPADTVCQVCLLLAALAVAALPALLRWCGLALRSPAALAPAAPRRAASAGRPYQARAPPR